MNAKSAELKEGQSHLKMRMDELITVHDKHTEGTAELTRLRTQNVNKEAEMLGSGSAVTKIE